MRSLSQLQEIFQNYLDENQFSNTPVELYEPVNYILSLGGKRLRPIMLLMAYNLFKDDIEKALPAAYSIEVFHNFSLVHDDIMDKAPLRRGKPAVHKKYDENTGILSGDVMLIYAFKYLMHLEKHEAIVDIIKLFNQIAIDVCEGQQLDMNFEKRTEVTIDEYIKMIGLKTAALLAGGMKMGALIAGASESNAQHLYDFGKNVGIAFQLQDDILDTFGDPKKFGKKVGGDIAQNKKTYLALRAMELASDSLKAQLKEAFSTTPMDEKAKIEKVTEIYHQLNIQQEANQVKESFLRAAFEAFDKIEVPESNKAVIKELANDLMKREV